MMTTESKKSTGTLRIPLTGSRVVLVDFHRLDDRAYKDVVGICVTNSQAPETLLANLRRVPGVLAAHFE